MADQQNIRLDDLSDWGECYDARESIQNDSRNCLGGLVAWNSGRTTYLTAAAQRKVNAIDRKMRLFDGDDPADD